MYCLTQILMLSFFKDKEFLICDISVDEKYFSTGVY